MAAAAEMAADGSRVAPRWSGEGKGGKRESCQSEDQSLQAWPPSGGAVLGARSQACCHAGAFTGTQRKIERCWQQVASLIHPVSFSV